MTNKEKFLAGHRFVLDKEPKGGEVMFYNPPKGHPFGSILTAGFKHQIAICEIQSITENRFFAWTFWLGKHQSREVLFTEIRFLKHEEAV